LDRPPAHQLTAALERLRADAAAIAAAAVAGVSPRVLMPTALADLASSLPTVPPVHVLAVGKAAVAMFEAFGAVAPWAIAEAVVIGPHRPADWTGRHGFIAGGHPLANAGSVEGGQRALALAAAVPSDGTLICLLSGGASALMAAPMAGLSLATKQRVVAQVMKAGGDIRALNAVRKHLSAVKGGRLAAACAGAVTTLAISDVIGDDLSVIGSGPCVPDASTWDEAFEVLRRFTGSAAPDPDVLALAEAGRAGRIADTPKWGDARLARSNARVIGGRNEAMAAAAARAAALGYTPVVIPDAVAGEARSSALAWWRDVRERLAAAEGPLAIVSSGETTVTVRGPGRGGRNQEFALALVDALQDTPRPAALISIGTDGIDGPTDAAGAVVDPCSAERARAGGLGAPGDYLERNDSYVFFEALGDLVRPGPSDTNVGDIQVLVARRD